MTPPALHHLALKVVDLAAAEAFYVGVLGLPVLRRWPREEATGDRSVWLDLGAGAFLALERAGVDRVPKIEEEAGYHLVALRIRRADREAMMERLTVAGFPVYQETAFTFYVRDPEGNRLGLSHWPDPR
jgi:catechol 2,3-dioxygenase-like lactoylglutathione lyase family enzyme